MPLHTIVLSLAALVLAPATIPADEGGWVELSNTAGFDAWRGSPTGWIVGGDAHLAPDNPKRLAADPGRGVIVNGPTGRETNLISKDEFGDVEFHCEFLVSQGSNSGVKFQEVYEIQIYDSHGARTLDGATCGGIYPRAERKPKYHHIDDGFPPRTNASKAPGAWQSLDVIFQAPRFDPAGKKTANARFVKVVLNGQVVHDNRDVGTPTGNNWHNAETPSGPIFLQGDHGPVAFRNVRARPWNGDASGD